MLVTLKRPDCKRASLSKWVDHFSIRTPTLSVNTCVRACTHTHIHTYAYICKHAHTGNVCIFPLCPSASPAVIDVLFHSAQHKLRRHGYSCRDVLSPGDGQYWNNNHPNNTTDHTPPCLLTTHCLSCLVQFAMLRGNYCRWQHYKQPAPAPDSAQGLLWCFSWKNPWVMAESPVGQGLGAVATYWHRMSICRISYCS